MLDSTSGDVFLQALVNRKQNFGSLFKSNWNGTYYSLILDHVHEDSQGHVDFEKISGIDGVALANQVINPDVSGNAKELITKITYDDGK